MKDFGLRETVIKQIVDIILKYKKPQKIIIFGSRAGNDFKPVSDIDIAIMDKNFTDRDTNIIKFNLEEYVKTPLKFDVLNFHSLSKETLRNKILKEGIVIYES